MKKYHLLLAIMFVACYASGQTFFSKILDFGGDEMEGKLFNVLPLQDEIKLIGAIHDSIVPGFEGGTWHVLGGINYEGEYLGETILVDSLYSNSFRFITKRISFKNDSVCYLYDRRDLGNTFYDAYIIELNVNTGKILKSNILFDEVSSNEGFLASDMTIGENGDLYLINFTTKSGPHPQILTILDSNLMVKSQHIIPNYGRDNITKYVELDPAGNLILVGVSLGTPTNIWYETKLFRQVIDTTFTSIEFKLASTSYDQSILFLDLYPVLKSKSGNWVIASQVVTKTPDCSSCSIWVPYMVGINNDFSQVLWETRLFDGNINSNAQEYNANSITEVSDGYIFAGASEGEPGLETSGLIGKVSLTGDSLWLKHLIPLEWDTTQARFFHMHDIKTTPLGNIVIGGYGSDKYSSTFRPWVLHLDPDGCLEPGCNTVSTSDPEFSQKQMFAIYPNPASTFVGVNCLQDFPTDCLLSIIDFSGKLILNKQITPRQGFQYVINVPANIHGQFVLRIETRSGKNLYSESIYID